jgi:hypothetical protein
VETEYIKSFLTKMATQDNRGTRALFFYVIRTNVKDSAPLENCDETRIFWNDSDYASMEELKAYLAENEYSEKETADAIRESCEYGIRYRWDEQGMFLTETDALQHLKLNHYHYSHDAHTYVKHAWRAPELEEFFDSLFRHFEIERPK